jgi:hypothetical protein
VSGENHVPAMLAASAVLGARAAEHDAALAGAARIRANRDALPDLHGILRQAERQKDRARARLDLLLGARAVGPFDLERHIDVRVSPVVLGDDPFDDDLGARVEVGRAVMSVEGRANESAERNR